jgi:H+/Cl- antiporter ClcA
MGAVIVPPLALLLMMALLQDAVMMAPLTVFLIVLLMARWQALWELRPMTATTRWSCRERLHAGQLRQGPLQFPLTDNNLNKDLWCVSKIISLD